MSLPVWIFIILIALVILWLIFIYNGLITLKNRVKEAWSDIEVQLKRRYDLIPNLVEAVKGYAKHERNLLTEITKARTAAMQAKAPAEKDKAENILSSALKTLFAVAENYPDLKASENFAKLQDELSDTENKIQAARRFYNTNVRDFNTKIEIFPNNLIANSLGFKQYELFEAGEGEEKPVKVDF
ncbi:LemA family protein [Candidatus Berkelbacteria bacterium]|nr:LemA family protein [Candidatus Berkelbacteria bacterium]MBI2588391.1 LemA family protein [Candidatus Berkelbacteria bacterium]